jgi:hypothetical protein
VEDICPSRLRVHSVNKYVAETHRIHLWRWCPDSNTLLYLANGTATIDVYSNTTKKLNCYTKTETCPRSKRGEICSVEEIQPGVFRFTSTACRAPTAPFFNSFIDVLRKRRYTWLWEHMLVEGGTEWVSEAIQDGSLVTVTDGSCIGQLFPNMCSAAFILECTKGRGKIIRSF